MGAGGRMEGELNRVLVTGAGGYLGQHVLHEVERQGVRAVGLFRQGPARCDLLKADEVRAAIRHYNPGVVVHCAAITPGRSEFGYNGEDDARLNASMVENLLAAGVTRVVFISSMTVYGRSQRVPVVESSIDPQSAYARGKLAAERVLLAAAEQSGGAILRLPGLFGPPRRDGIVYALCSALKRGTPVVLPQDPVTWGAMHVVDAAEVIAQAAIHVSGEKRNDHKPYIIANVGYPERQSIARLVATLAGMTNVYMRTDVEHPDFEMDLSELAATFGVPNAGLSERLAQMLEYAAAPLD